MSTQEAILRAQAVAPPAHISCIPADIPNLGKQIEIACLLTCLLACLLGILFILFSVNTV